MITTVTSVTGFSRQFSQNVKLEAGISVLDENFEYNPSSSEFENNRITERNFLHQLYDKNRIGLNPIPGEMIRSRTRLMEIIGVWYRQGTRSRYELTEFLLPSGWDRIIALATNPAMKLLEMKSAYPSKSIELEAEVLENLFREGRVWWG